MPSLCQQDIFCLSRKVVVVFVVGSHGRNRGSKEHREKGKSFEHPRCFFLFRVWLNASAVLSRRSCSRFLMDATAYFVDRPFVRCLAVEVSAPACPGVVVSLLRRGGEIALPSRDWIPRFVHDAKSGFLLGWGSSLCFLVSEDVPLGLMFRFFPSTVPTLCHMAGRWRAMCFMLGSGYSPLYTVRVCTAPPSPSTL